MATNLLISEKRNTALPFAKYLGITDKSHVKFMKDGNVGYMEGMVRRSSRAGMHDGRVRR